MDDPASTTLTEDACLDEGSISGGADYRLDSSECLATKTNDRAEEQLHASVSIVPELRNDLPNASVVDCIEVVKLEAESSDVSAGIILEDVFAKAAQCEMASTSTVNLLNSEAEGLIATGIVSVLGPVMGNFDSSVVEALKSQSILNCSLDRLTRVLDKLLEDAPLPFIAQNAARLSAIHKRVSSMTTMLRIIQARIVNIERMLTPSGTVGHDGGSTNLSFETSLLSNLELNTCIVPQHFADCSHEIDSQAKNVLKSKEVAEGLGVTNLSSVGTDQKPHTNAASVD